MGHAMRRSAWTIVCIPLWIPVATPAGAAQGTGVLYHNGFETAADLPSHQFATSSEPVLLRKAIDRGDAAAGTSSLVMACRMRKGGYFYPMFPFAKEIPLDRGPVYLSGFVKIEQQHPEANHRLGLCAMGRFTKGKPGVWRGMQLRNHRYVETRNGWQYFFSDDLGAQARRHADTKGLMFEGACLTGIYLQMWNMRPSEVMRFRLDDVRLTRYNPVPPPDSETYRHAHDLYRRMAAERATLVPAEATTGARLARGLDVAADILANPHHRPEPLVRALLVGQVRRLEKPYWRLKLLTLAAE